MMVNRPDEGGAFEHVATLSDGLCERGFEVEICGPLEHRAAELSARVVPVDVTRALSPVADSRSIAALARELRRFRPDLIHAHGSKGGVMARAARLAGLRTPLVHTPHGYAFAGYQADQSHPRAYRAIERLLSPLASRVLCVCEAEASLARTVCPADRVRVVHNGIEPPSAPAEPIPLKGAEGRRVVAAISGLRAGKGLQTLLEALTRVVAAVPETLLVVAGEGPERSHLEQMAERLGVTANLRLIGNVDRPYGVLARAELFVNPSWAESFPYTILEAMAASMPMVATDVGGVGEAVEDRVTGLLVPARDPAALADATLGLLADPGLSASLGAAARARLEQRFSLTQMIEGVAEIYAELGIPIRSNR